MDRLVALGRWLLLLPVRFVRWVYQPTARAGPSRSEAIVHLRASGMGLDTTRWMGIESDERQRGEDEARWLR